MWGRGCVNGPTDAVCWVRRRGEASRRTGVAHVGYSPRDRPTPYGAENLYSPASGPDSSHDTVVGPPVSRPSGGTKDPTGPEDRDPSRPVPKTQSSGVEDRFRPRSRAPDLFVLYQSPGHPVGPGTPGSPVCVAPESQLRGEGGGGGRTNPGGPSPSLRGWTWETEVVGPLGHRHL